MNDSYKASGRCLCGAVAVHVEVDKASVDACHCTICRRWGGGPLLAVGAPTGVDLDGEESISVYSSSEWAERGFCRHCGTHLFYRPKGEQHYALPVGLIEGDLPWTFSEQIFIDEKPAWYAFANETHDMTGAEVFAKFGAPG